MADRPDPLLRAADIAAMAGLAKTHFLNPKARRLNKSLGDATGMTGLGIHLIEVQPGDVTTEHHVHHHEDEAVFILSGTADAYIGDRVESLGPGDFLGYAAGGEAHSLVATGDEPLRCLVVGQRLDHDVADYPRKRKRIFRNVGQPWTLVDHDALESVVARAKK
ncbi:MAG: cupin domain-containing protein [Pseudomonadota bacterium]